MSGADETLPPPGEQEPETPPTLTAEEQAAAMASYAATLRRVERLTVVLGVLGSAAAAVLLDWRIGAGMLAGAALGWINFRGLAASVNSIGDRIVNAHSQERGAAVVVRGVGRIFLIALVAYAIFSCSVRSLVGYLAGLTMPVFALMCEAAYEFVAGNRRTS